MVSPNAEARLPIDENTPVPPAVRAAAAAAEAAHKAAYQPPAGDPPVQPQPSQEQAAPVPPPAPVQQDPAPQPAPPSAIQPDQPQPTPQPQQPAPNAEQYPDKTSNLSADQWRHQYLSMKGRYEQAAASMGSMQEQLSQMGDELMRLTQTVNRGAPQQPQNPQAPAQPLLTDEDVNTVGADVLDIIQRAARQAVAPDLQNLQRGVQQVNQQVTRTRQGDVYAQLQREIPDWVAINNSERFKAWARLPDVYSGALRGGLLNRALQAGNAARVIAIFKGFLSEEQATGQISDPLQPPAPQPARVATVPLVSLTAPGRAKPAPGELPASADKPIYTRQQIAAFYADVRRGVYNGRPADKDAQERSIFQAQLEGRVR
jgi:hypothetical protein